MLILDGVYIDNADKFRVRFRWVKAPTSYELTRSLQGHHKGAWTRKR